ncbi:hypothetical protein C2U72_25910, partial [Prosthecomicrobium hirschii]|uniref:YcjX family protein n=1 Tax=Prosthecodimorpha hirschii TaxID=665126 RepID=UPI001AED803E
RQKGAAAEDGWNAQFAAYRAAHPELAAEFLRRMAGDLPADPDVLFRQVAAGAAAGGDPAATASLAPDVSFVRFRPPRLERTAEGMTLSLPHIRLDRVLEFLIGDRLT